MIDGGCAEYVKCPEVNCLPYPENLTWEASRLHPAGFSNGLAYAPHTRTTPARRRRLDLRRRQRSRQRRHSNRRHVRRTHHRHRGQHRKLEKARQLGAHHLINHKTQKIREEVRRITNKRGVDVVFEHVGTATWDESVASLAVGGRLITCGATTGYDAKIDLRFLFTRQLSLLGSYMGTKSELAAVIKLVASGKLKPVIDRTFPLADCADAHRYLESGDQFGKVVLTV